MIEGLEMKSSGRSYYDAEASQNIDDQIVVESNKEVDTDEISLCYGIASERVISKILNARAPNFFITCVSPDNEVIEEFRKRGSSRTQHHKTRQGQIDDKKSLHLWEKIEEFNNVGSVHIRQRLLPISSSNTNTSGGSDKSNDASGPPLATILAGVLVFCAVCWVIGSIAMWLISLITNVPPSK
ncbi:putative cytokinin hydroxylase-like [Capsicum annuum]|nr:putative cytokinin hydroxylase-like [Capsicum annuum]